MDMETVKEMCGDNRFEVIQTAKEHLIEATNIESSPDEMKVLDSFLFRAWQMGWLSDYDPDKTAIMRGCIMDCKNCWKTKLVNPVQEWVSVDERLPNDELDKLVYLSSGRITIANYNDHVLPHSREPIGWGYDCKNGYIDYEKECVTHWMPLPELPKGE